MPETSASGRACPFRPDPPARDPELPRLRVATAEGAAGLHRHLSEGPPRLPPAWQTPRAGSSGPTPATPRGALAARPSLAQHELLQLLDALEGAAGPATPSPRRLAAADPTAQAAAARVRELAPELLEDGVPITAGAAIVGSNGLLFDGARAGIAGLAARLDGAPLLPCLAADVLLEFLASTPAATPAAFADAAACALRCPIGLDVPAVPITARDGQTYGGGALTLHLAGQRSRGGACWLPVSREPQVGPLPPPNLSLLRLASRLDLVAAEAVAEEEGARAAAAALDAAPPAPGDDEPSTLDGIQLQSVFLVARQPLDVSPTALAMRNGRVALGAASGELTLMAGSTGAGRRSWQAHRAALHGRGGVAHVALSDVAVVSLGGFLPAPGARASVPKVWNFAGELLARLVPPPAAIFTSLHAPGDTLVMAPTAGGDVASWQLSPGLARAPRRDRHLGPDARIGVGDDGARTAIAAGSRLELSTTDDVAAGPLSLATAEIRRLLPCDDAVVLLDARGRIHLHVKAGVARPGWPAGALAPATLPTPLDGRPVAMIAACRWLWAAADDDGSIAVLAADGTPMGTVQAPGPVALMAVDGATLLAVTGGEAPSELVEYDIW